jgi:hypothetical protein
MVARVNWSLLMDGSLPVTRVRKTAAVLLIAAGLVVSGAAAVQADDFSVAGIGCCRV